PVVVPSFQLPTLARPLASLVSTALIREPPPVATANVTVVPATGLPNGSVTITSGAVATVVLTMALCASPAYLAIWLAAAGVAVAVARGVAARDTPAAAPDRKDDRRPGDRIIELIGDADRRRCVDRGVHRCGLPVAGERDDLGRCPGSAGRGEGRGYGADRRR